MLILQTLARAKPLHGFEIAESIQQTSADVLQVEEGSLYPALQRMLVKGWIAGDWGKTAENRRARYYRTTPKGLSHLAGELAKYRRVAGAIARILAPA
jgi:PadR family transcriptional regulator, regulatory protein PadR